MVHFFSYNHNGKEHHFLWDIESGSLHNVDRQAYLVAKDIYGSLDNDEKKEFSDIDDNTRKEITGELRELEACGFLMSKTVSADDRKKIGEIKALCLLVCNDCNLRCKYCFADEGTYHTSRKYMSEEVGKKAIDFLIANSGNRRSLEVDFFGGEPLMNFDTVKAIVAYAREREKVCEKKFSFTMTTNCLLLFKDKIDYLNEEMDNVVLSIDGRKDIHNRVRKTVNGNDAYDVILNNALEFRKVRGNRSYYVRSTFTAYNLDFASDVLYLNDLGFDQISMEPVVLPPSSDMALKEEHLPKIKEEYTRLAGEYIKRRKGDKWFNFFHFMIDLDNGPCIKKRLTGCGAGCEYLSVSPSGDLYPCHQFAEDSKYYMGNVLKDDFSTAVSEEFSRNIVTQKEKCSDCFAKYYCSGGCAANNTHFMGSMDKPYEISCEMMKKRLELSLAISAIERSLTDDKEL